MLRIYFQRFGMTGGLAGLILVLIFAGARPVQAGPSLADTVRFLQQSSFGPTPPLISRVQQIGFEAFLNEQFSAPTMDYPNLEFWPQTRPTSCTGTAKETIIRCTPYSAIFSVMRWRVKTNCANVSLSLLARFWLLLPLTFHYRAG